MQASKALLSLYICKDSPWALVAQKCDKYQTQKCDKYQTQKCDMYQTKKCDKYQTQKCDM